MKKVKFVLFCFFIGLCGFSGLVKASNPPGIFNALSLGLSAGTTGVGVELATPVTPFLALRGGVSFMPAFKIRSSVGVTVEQSYTETFKTDVDLTGSMKRTSGEMLLNCYPFRNSSFFVAGGIFFKGEDLLRIKGHSEELKELIAEYGQADIVIGDYMVPVDENGDVSGGFKASKVRPYIGIGFGRVVPAKRLAVGFDLGVQFQRKPVLYTDYGDLGEALEGSNDDFTRIMNKLTVYPVLRIRLNGRIF